MIPQAPGGILCVAIIDNTLIITPNLSKTPLTAFTH